MDKELVFRGECLKIQQILLVKTPTLLGEFFVVFLLEVWCFSHAEKNTKGYYGFLAELFF
jgi:hypothetical protein